MMPSASFALIYWLALQCAWTVRCQESESEGDEQPVEVPPTNAIEETAGPLTSPPIASSTDVFGNACVSDIEACGSLAGLLKSCVAGENQLECRCQSEITSLEHSCHFIDAKECQGTAFNPATIRTEVMFYGQCEGGAEAWAEAVGTELAEAGATATEGSESESTAEGSESHGEEEDSPIPSSTSTHLTISTVALLFSFVFGLSL